MKVIKIYFLPIFYDTLSTGVIIFEINTVSKQQWRHSESQMNQRVTETGFLRTGKVQLLNEKLEIKPVDKNLPECCWLELISRFLISMSTNGKRGARGR
jgi:hypothetical protein